MDHKDIARRIYKGELWGTFITDPLVKEIFMPLIFSSLEQWSEMVRDRYVYFIGEMDKTFPRSINGYPMFYSCQGLSDVDTAKVFAELKKIHEAVGEEDLDFATLDSLKKLADDNIKGFREAESRHLKKKAEELNCMVGDLANDIIKEQEYWEKTGEFLEDQQL